MSFYSNIRHQLRSDRKDVRVDAELPVKVGRPGGEFTTALVIDISLGGMRISCGHELISHILPAYPRTVGYIMDVEIELQFRLPSAGQRAAPIKVRARVIHSERLAQDCYHVGIEFIDLNQVAANKLDAFIQKSH